MNLIMKCARFLVLLVPSLWLAVPALADDGDGAECDFIGLKCVFLAPPAEQKSDYSRPGSVIVFPKFVRDGGNVAVCGAGNVLVNGICLPRTEIELGATCPTRFTVVDQANIPCPDHDPVRVKFSWVCPGTERNPTCKTTGFDVHLTVNGKVVFTANGSTLPDTNQVPVPVAPCDKGYLIGWVINDLGQPIKYDGLIGEALIRNSGTAAAAYRAIAIQGEATRAPGSLIEPFPDPLNLKPLALPFVGLAPAPPDLPGPYRLVTGQVTGDVTFDSPAPAAGPGFDSAHPRRAGE
jgi:hypothetical protein